MKRYYEYTVTEPKYGFELKGLYDAKTGTQYEEILYNKDFINIGIVPTPKNKIQHFKYDILHGLLMGYNIFAVIEYAIRYYFDYWVGWGKGRR